MSESKHAHYNSFEIEFWLKQDQKVPIDAMLPKWEVLSCRALFKKAIINIVEIS